ncbi:MAG: 4-(cytidine 5'-diphospho)-2-C-methyl-D-erythritol kinase [Bacteroidales bacterium]
MILYPKAKINLGLKVTGKRPDHFHNIESLLVSLPALTDILEIVESNSLSFNSYGIPLSCREGENLCERAFHLLRREYGISPVEINLYKRIPSGAGLGGGSSNGASTLIALNWLFKLNIEEPLLLQYGAELGSDLPFFILENLYGKKDHFSALVKDRGENPSIFNLPLLQKYRVELYYSNIAISTAEAFSRVTPKESATPLELLLQEPVERWRESVENHFEEPLFAQYPKLRELKERLYREGAHFVLMSGTGPTLFALFPREGKGE